MFRPTFPELQSCPQRGFESGIFSGSGQRGRLATAFDFRGPSSSPGVCWSFQLAFEIAHWSSCARLLDALAASLVLVATRREWPQHPVERVRAFTRISPPRVASAHMLLPLRIRWLQTDSTACEREKPAEARANLLAVLGICAQSTLASKESDKGVFSSNQSCNPRAEGRRKVQQQVARVCAGKGAATHFAPRRFLFASGSRISPLNTK